MDWPAFRLGELTEVNPAFVNEGTLETEGVDVSMLWGWDMPNVSSSIPGQV